MRRIHAQGRFKLAFRRIRFVIGVESDAELVVRISARRDLEGGTIGVDCRMRLPVGHTEVSKTYQRFGQLGILVKCFQKALFRLNALIGGGKGQSQIQQYARVSRGEDSGFPKMAERCLKVAAKSLKVSERAHRLKIVGREHKHPSKLVGGLIGESLFKKSERKVVTCLAVIRTRLEGTSNMTRRLFRPPGLQIQEADQVVYERQIRRGLQQFVILLFGLGVTPRLVQSMRRLNCLDESVAWVHRGILVP